MGSFPAPYIAPNPMEQYGQYMQLRTMMQNAPLQRQLLQQQVQGAQMENQMRQQQIADNQTWMTAAQSATPGSTIGDILPSLRGKISLQSYASLAKTDLELRQSAQNLSKTEVENHGAALKEVQSIYNNIANLPDDQLAQSTAQIAAQVNPFLARMALPGQQPVQIDPSKPLTRQALQQFGTTMGLWEGYLSQEAGKKKEAAETTKDANQSEAALYKESNGQLVNVQTGQPLQIQGNDPEKWNALVDSVVPPTGDNSMLNGRTKSLVSFYLQHGNIAEAQKAITEAGQQVGVIEKETNPQVIATREQVAAVEGRARAQAFGQLREYPVFDNVTKQTVYMSPAEINAAKQSQPGRFTAPAYSPEALIQQGTGRSMAPGGKVGEEINAFNTAIQHADLLQKAATALNNGDIRGANQIANQIGIQFGSNTATNFNVISQAYTREVNKALTSGHVSDSEIKQIGETIPTNASPAQIGGAINAYRSLMQSKMNIRQQQYQNGMQGQPNFQGGGANNNQPQGTAHSDLGFTPLR